MLAIVALEVAVTLSHPPAGWLLAGLLVLALIEAGLGLLYFMHLKYERRSLMWSVILAVMIAVVLMDHFWQRVSSAAPAALRTLNSPAMHATMTAMVVLMVPAFLICAAVAIVAFRKRKPPSPPG